MTRFRLLIVVVVAGLVGASLAHASGSSVEIVLRPAGANVSQAQLERSVEIMRTRLARLGAHGSITHRAGSPLVILRLEVVARPAALQIAKLLSQPARLAFYDLTPSLLAPSIDRQQNAVATTNLADLLGRARVGSGLPSAAYLFDTRAEQVVAGPVPGPAARTDLVRTLLERYHGRLPAGTKVLIVPPHATVITCNVKTSIVCPGINGPLASGVTYYYLFKPRPQLTRDDLVVNGTRPDFDPASGAPIVTIKFTPRGDKLFHMITRAEAMRGQVLGTPQHFAIVLDDQLRSWPQIDYTKYPDGIDPSGGGIEITGLFSAADAKNVALVLQTSALPVTFTVVPR